MGLFLMDNFNYIEMIRNQVERVIVCERKMTQWAVSYREWEAAGSPANDLPVLKALGRNAVTQPSRCQAKLQGVKDFLTTQLGTQAAALTVIDTTLANFHGGLFTRPMITSRLADLAIHQDTILNGINTLGWTPLDVAVYIETNMTNAAALAEQPEATGWVQPTVGGSFA